MPDAALYPEIAPFRVFRQRVSPLHELHVEQCGNPEGAPVVVLHGGPGGGISPGARRFFDPAHYHIILFEQRGAGRSTPYADLRENTTWDLVADIERIRETLGIERWAVFGGSWGATLALAYAQTHPERARALILRGVFLCRRAEIDWFYNGGAGQVFPEYWAVLRDAIPEAERADLVTAYHRRVNSGPLEDQIRFAQLWSRYEAAASALYPRDDRISAFGDARFALAFARIETHYFVNGGFLEEGQLLRDAHRLSGIPGAIVQGRYDMVTPLRSAWELARAWPEAKLTVVPDAGHAISEPGIAAALAQAADALRAAD